MHTNIALALTVRPTNDIIDQLDSHMVGVDERDYVPRTLEQLERSDRHLKNRIKQRTMYRFPTKKQQ